MNNQDKWNTYVKAKNIGKTTEQRCFGLLTENGLKFSSDNIIKSINLHGTRFYDRNSMGTINRCEKICKDFIKTLQS